MLILISRLLFMTAVWRVAEGKAPLPFKSDGKCNDMTSEYYIRDLQICCSRCKPGTRLVVPCNMNSDTVCEPCGQGQYSDKYNHYPNCFSCRRCKEEKGLVYITNCSADTDSVCGCKPGMFSSKALTPHEVCKKHRSCKPGQYTFSKGTNISDVICEQCPNGTFSNQINAESCKLHTQCEGGLVLRQGNSIADTQCAMTPTAKGVSLKTSSKNPKPIDIWSQVEGVITTTTQSLLPSSSTTTRKILNPTTIDPDLDTKTIIYCTVIVCGVLVLLTLTVMVITCKLRKRKADMKKVPVTVGNKQVQNPSESSTPDCQHLLPADKCQKEPSMTSSDSQSQPDSSQSHSSGDWLERTSQEESLLELPSVSSPLVNLSITATFNCQLNPTTASCSIPLNPSALTPHVEVPVPLSQEEVCISCQQEDGKEALQSVQESSPCAF